MMSTQKLDYIAPVITIYQISKSRFISTSDGQASTQSYSFTRVDDNNEDSWF